MSRTSDVNAATSAPRRPAPAVQKASDPAPRVPGPGFAAWWAAAVYILAAMALAYPALGGAWLVALHSDQYIAGYAFREYAAAALRAGDGFPQWNPFLFGGMPYIAAMHGDIFYPTFLLRMLMPTDQAMTWSFVIHLVLAGFFTYGFLRAWGSGGGIGFYGALIGGLAYLLSGPIAAYASPGHDGKLFVSALLPLTLWMLVLGVRDGRLWAWGALALTVGLAVLSPHPQLLQYMLLASGSFALYLAFGAPSGMRLARSLAVKRLGLALGAVLVGAAIGAVQYLPVRGYVDWSPRAGGKEYAHAVSYSLPTEELLNAFVPQFSGILDRYWGVNGIHFHSEYPGIVVLVLAGAGLFAGAARSRGFRLFWAGTFIVSLLWALGGSTPFYQLIYAVVPGAKYFRAPSTMMFVTMFALAVFAALGAERVISAATTIPKRFVVGWAIAIVLIAVLFSAGLPVAVAESIASRMSGIYPPEVTARFVDGARANEGAVLAGSIRSLMFTLLALGVIWAAMRNRVRTAHIAWALAALVAADLWSIERQYWIFSPPARVAFASDPAIEILKRSPSPGRVVTWDPMRSAAYRDPAFKDALMVHRQRLAEGYHGNELGRYQRIVEAESSRSPLRTTLSPEFLRHENVQYLYTTVPDSLIGQIQTPLQWASPALKLAGPVRNAAGSTIYLYKLPGDNPAAWVASAIVKATDEQAFGTVLDPRFDPRTAAIVDTASGMRGATLTTAPPPASVQARVTRFEPGRIDVDLDAPAPAGAALVVSENYYPGWASTVDGKPAITARANFNLTAVELPAGGRRIQLRFADPAYGPGKAVTWVALLLALAAFGGGIVIERRRLVPAS